MSNERRAAGTPPPSFDPGARRPRPAAAEDAPIVVGTSHPSGSATPRRPVSPAGAPPAVPPAVPARRQSRPTVPGAAPAAEPTPTRIDRAVPHADAARGHGERPPGSTHAIPAPVRPATARRTVSSSGRPGPQVGAAAPVRGGQTERPAAGPEPAGRARVHRRRRAVVLTLVLVLVLLLAWPVGLAMWANGRLHHVSALSAAAATPGTTYLLAGSDQRPADMQDGTAGARSDTILVLHVPTSGPTALISIPRDSYVPIPGHGSNKINAAYSWGGPKLLVATVEKLTGMKVDHYVEVGFGGIETVVNAVGGVHLCSDLNVHDQLSGLVWTPGCRTVDGTTALAFSRMRYSDPTGDVGRTARQRQVISAITKVAASPSVLLAPGKQVALVRAGTDSLTVDDATGVLDLGRLALDFRAATGPKGITGTPPIKSLDYRPGNVGATVQLDPATTPTFFAQIRDGKLPAGTVGGTPK